LQSIGLGGFQSEERLFGADRDNNLPEVTDAKGLIEGSSGAPLLLNSLTMNKATGPRERGRSAGFQGRAWSNLDPPVGRSYASHHWARARCCRCAWHHAGNNMGSRVSNQGDKEQRAHSGQRRIGDGRWSERQKQWTWRRVPRVTSRQLNRANDGTGSRRVVFVA
jgi:hypothetical protein